MTLNDNTEECNHRPITSIITYLTMGHFILMALYNTFIRYKKHRLGYMNSNNGNGNGDETNGDGSDAGSAVLPPYWLSYVGRIYNPAIGPNVETLLLFGGFHPVLVVDGMDFIDGLTNNDDGSSGGRSSIVYNSDGGSSSNSGDWWRFGIGAICCTSVVQIICNIFVLTFLGGMEHEIGSWNILVVYSLSVLSGGLITILHAYRSIRTVDDVYATTTVDENDENVFLYNKSLEVT